MEEWETGIQINKNLDVIDMETKYNAIFDSMKIAEIDTYASPILKTMYEEWWNQAL